MRKTLLFLIILLITGCNAFGTAEGVYKKGSPQTLICKEDEMPGKYLLMEEFSGARPNKNLTMDINDPEESTRYINATGRLEGWEHRFMLIEPTQSLPGFVLCQVVLFKSSQGASEALWWNITDTQETLDVEQEIGDEIILTETSFKTPDGSPWIEYRVEFTFHNLLGAVSTYMPEEIAEPDYALNLAENLYHRFQESLSD